MSKEEERKAQLLKDLGKINTLIRVAQAQKKVINDFIFQIELAEFRRASNV